MTRTIATILIAGFMFAGLATPLVAKEADLRPIGVGDYFALKYIGSPTVGPDGKWVAYTVRTQDLEKDSRGTRIWMSPVSGGDPMPMTAKGSSAWSPRWSPDGSHLSFVAVSRESDSSQVFTLDLRGGERVQLTNVAGGVESYEWSPDGEYLAFINEQETGGPGFYHRPLHILHIKTGE